MTRPKTFGSLILAAAIAALLILAAPLAAMAQDTDGDGIPDGVENVYCTDVANPDTDGDGLCDGSLAVGSTCGAGEDQNDDGVVDAAETDPCNPDTDGDGLGDGWEAQYSGCGFDPLSYWSELVYAPRPAVNVIGTFNNIGELSLTWTGSQFGVSWRDFRNLGWEIFQGRATPEGASFGPETRVTNSDSQAPSLTWTGSEYGLSWVDSRDGNFEIYFNRVSAGGSLVGPELRVTNAPSDGYYPSLVWTGTEFGVSWHDLRDGVYEIYFARVSAGGSKVGSDLRVTNDAAFSVASSLAWAGSEFGMSWHDWRDGNYEIYFARVSAGGAKIGSDLRVTNAASDSKSSSLAWTDSEFGVSWYDQRDGNAEIYFARVSAGGAKIGAELRITNNPFSSSSPSLVWTGSEFGVSWHDMRDGLGESYFAHLAVDGPKIGPDVRVTKDGLFNNSSALAWTGSEYVVGWLGQYAGNQDVYFTRLYQVYTDKDGDLLDESGEYASGADPCNPDTDGAGVPDGREVRDGTDPATPGDELLADWFVHPRGDYFGGDGSALNPFGTLGEAVEVAASGDTVFIAGGEIPEWVFPTDIMFKDLYIFGGFNPDSWHLRNVAVFHSVLTPIRSDWGTVVIDGVVVEGGPIGIFNNDGWLTVSNSIIRNNNIGIYNDGYVGAITQSNHNLFLNNNSSIVMYSYEYAMNDVYSENDTMDGGGVFLYGDPYEYGSLTVRNNIIWDPAGVDLNVPTGPTVNYSDVEDGAGGTGNISQDPLFYDPAFTDHSLRLGSPAIDAGDPAPAYNDRDGTRNDMGFTGGQGSAFSDRDHDAMPDDWETYYGLDQGDSTDGPLDGDNDQLINRVEYFYWTDPTNPDTDGDGMEDGWELITGSPCGIDPLVKDSSGDPDGDGLTNLMEHDASTDPCVLDADSDDDGLADAYETFIGTLPGNPDTDGDGVIDGVEHLLDLTDPLDPDNFMTLVPRLMNYQCRLEDSAGNPVDGQLPATFNIYDSASGNTLLWKEGSTIEVVGGLADVVLGGGTIIPGDAFNNDETYLELVLSGETLIPRRQLTSRAYSMNASRVDNKRFLSGVETLTVNNQSQVTVRVTFPRSFATVPRVAVGAGRLRTYANINGTYAAQQINNVTSAGFTIVLEAVTGQTNTGTLNFTWFAHGE